MLSAARGDVPAGERLRPGLYLVGYGVSGGSEGCTRAAWDVLNRADYVVFRWDADQIYQELCSVHNRVTSVAKAYRQHGTTAAAYRAMVRAVRDMLATGASVAFATPGHPLLAEAAAQELLAACTESGGAVTVIGGVSFLDVVGEALAVDLSQGTLIIAGEDFNESRLRGALQSDADVLICSVRTGKSAEEPYSELERMRAAIREVCPDTQPISLVVGLTDSDGRTTTTVRRLTVGRLPGVAELARLPRVSYFVHASDNRRLTDTLR